MKEKNLLQYAKKIEKLNRNPFNYCEYVSDQVEDVVNDLADSDVTIIDETDVLLVLDQYSDGKSWVVEVWGPYTNDQFQFKQLLPLIKSHIKHFPAKLVFFYNGKNIKLTDWLEEQDALFSQQTIWQMCPFQAMNSNI